MVVSRGVDFAQPVVEGLKGLQNGEFALPVLFDIAATFFFALTGALAAMRRGYDVIGLIALGFVTGLGGALIRDGLFLQQGPPALTKDGRLLLAVLAGCAAGWLLGRVLERYQRAIEVLDAVGLGAYCVVGAHKSLLAGLSEPAAILVGVINACGGGLLRDIITREEPLVMRPGQFYALAALGGCVVFVTGVRTLGWSAPESALVAIGTTFLFRVLALFLDWRTVPLRPLDFDVLGDDDRGGGSKGGGPPPPGSGPGTAG